MKLRTRLTLGIVSITVVLLVPLILALRSLESVHQTTRSLRDREFAGSLVLGSFRELTDEVVRKEDAMSVLGDSASYLQMVEQLNRLGASADSLSRFATREASSDISNAVMALRASIDAQHAARSAGANNTADEISAQRTRPALNTIARAIARTEAKLRDETHERVEQAAQATVDAQRTAAGSLAIALLLATLIAIWLTRSISRPVHELDKGMKAVADGDFTQRLPAMEKRTDEFGRLANSYHGMTAQLAELDKLKAEFVSVASHELKTPINVIVGYLELLQENIYGELNPKQREICATLGKQAQTLTRLVKRLLDISRFEAGGGKLERRQVDLDRFLHSFETSFQVLALQREILATIGSQCQALTRLVKQLLDVSRFEAGGGRLEPHAVDVRAFLHELSVSFEALALQNEIQFGCEVDPRLPSTIEADPDRLNEVVGNLLSNAFKFTPRHGRIDLLARMGARANDDQVVIEVTDTGVGIPGDKLPHVFEKFYQVENAAQPLSMGSGLGLAIAKEIVEAHGGTITAESKAGNGTTFRVVLPIAHPHIDGAPSPRPR